MIYLHENPDWPKMTWDTKSISRHCSEVRHKQGKLLGRMESLGFDFKNQAFLTALTEEVVKTSSIEGENLNTDQVRSSIARKLGIKVSGLQENSTREVDGVVELMLDATRKFQKPLDENRLFSWHRCLFPKGKLVPYGISVGKWRTDEDGPMQVVSGAMGKEQVHYEAPAAEKVPSEMQSFFKWFNDIKNEEPLTRAAVAHFWFVTIHPFDDGNGRIGRAIAEMELARSDQSEDRFYSMSSQIFSERKEYYNQLESAQKSGMDITPWVQWFLGCLNRSIDSSEKKLELVLEKAKVWEFVNQFPVSERQKKIINKLLDDFEGYLTSSKYSRMAKCSKETAIRDIQDMMQKKILIKNDSGGRSTSYRLTTSKEF
jgi:Fic family protein